MAQNYTSAEINEAVTQLVRDAIRRTYGSLGNRELGLSFSDTQDAAAGVFLTTPSAPFYVVFLGVQRLRESISDNLKQVAELVDAIESTNRRVKPVDNLTSLGNARSALGALNSASSTRSSQFQSIEAIPAYQRFVAHTSRFLQQEGSNINRDGSIVRTPQQARAELSGLLQTALDSYSLIASTAGSLSKAIDDYNSLNLPNTLSQNILNNAQTLLQGNIDKLEALDPQERLEVLRGVVLDVLATRAAVRGFGSLDTKGTFVLLEGAGSTFADADHPAIAAKLTALEGDPFTILDGNDQLDFILDSGPTFTLALPHSFPARLEGTAPESYVIDATNDKLTFTLTGFLNLVVTLTHGTRTILQIVADINAAVGAQPLIAEPYFNPVKFTGAVNTTGATPTTLDFTRVEGPWSSVQVFVGDLLMVQDPLSPMNGYLFSVGLPIGATFTGTLIGAGVPVNATGVVVQVGPAARFLRVRVTDAGATAAVDNRSVLGLTALSMGATTLGMSAGSQSRSRGTRAEEIATALNGSPTSTVAGVPRLTVGQVFQSNLTGTTPARSEPTDPTRVVSSILRTAGTVTAPGLVVTILCSGAQTAGVVITDLVTLRTSAVPSNVAQQGTLLSVSNTQVQAVFPFTINPDTDMDIEFGLNILVPRDILIRIIGDDTNAGDYLTADPVPNDDTAMSLQRGLPVFVGDGGQPVLFTIDIGQNHPTFTSTSLLTNSRIEIDGSAFIQLWGLAGPDVASGETNYVHLPSDPKTIELGDIIEIHETDPVVTDALTTIVGLELSQLLVQVDPAIPSTSNIVFSNTSPIPFTRIRKGQFDNYDTMVVSLDTWKNVTANQSTYAAELNRLINPLLSNTNPTMGAVNTAKLFAQEMVTALDVLDTILSDYTTDVVPRVDTLVETMLSRGADRAVDTLLVGKFSTFFGYNSDEVSYIGNAMGALREVQRLDLPVRRTGRQERLDTELSLGAGEEADFEFDQSDTEAGEEVDIPGQFIDLPEGGSF